MKLATRGHGSHSEAWPKVIAFYQELVRRERAAAEKEKADETQKT